MSMSTTATPRRSVRAWTFEVKSVGADTEAGTLTVHRASGRWATVLNMETGAITRMVHVYDATFVGVTGKQYHWTVTSKDLRWLRKPAKAEQAVTA